MCLVLIRNVLDLFLLFFFFFFENFYFHNACAVRFWKYIHCKKMFGGE